jgi:hypothetical protein
MHLSPAALDAAIRLLETGTESRGGILEAAGHGSRRLLVGRTVGTAVILATLAVLSFLLHTLNQFLRGAMRAQ